MIPKIISQSTYELLESNGHAVPRTATNYIQTGWKIGQDYLVKSEKQQKPLKVRCTQDCPFHLRVNED